MKQLYWEETVSVWPELAPYHNDIHIIYAGLSPERSILNRTVEHIQAELEANIALGKRVMFYSLEESLIKPVLYLLQEVVNRTSCDPANIVLTTSAVDGAEVYRQLCATEGWTRAMLIASGYYFERTNFHTDLLAVPEYQAVEKTKLFVSFNRVPRSHRSKLLAKMFELDLVSKAYYSYEGSFNSDKLGIWGADRDILEPYKDQLPLHLDITEDSVNPSSFTSDDVAYHTNSYFSLVTETCFDYTSLAQSSIFISEKTYRPICYKHPFILAARPFTLKALKLAGYKTFDPWINEAYDTMSNDAARLDFIAEEIARLSKLTLNDWITWQKQLAPIVEYNYDVFRTKTAFGITKQLDQLLNLA